MTGSEATLVTARDTGGTGVMVAAVQMVSTPRVDDNLDRMRHWVAMAAREGAELVLLPEYFCLMGAEGDKVARREPHGLGPSSPIQSALSETARRHGLWIIGGTVPLHASTPDRVRNAVLVFGPDGLERARYDKIHLFAFRKGAESYDESVTIEPGDTPVACQTPAGLTGLAVCYDLRFPELFRQMGPLDLLVMPAAFTYTTGRAHWEMLLRTRAVENQCYVLASAQGGQHENGRRTWGHSMLIDPWGDILALHPEGEGLVMGRIDPHRRDDIRASLPALRHRVF
jgi:predicted amidohydrolase